jgi:hypothetical protein
MEITLRKYRSDTKKWQCYEITENDAKITGNLFFPLGLPLPDTFTITLPEFSDLVPTA